MKKLTQSQVEAVAEALKTFIIHAVEDPEDVVEMFGLECSPKALRAGFIKGDVIKVTKNQISVAQYE